MKMKICCRYEKLKRPTLHSRPFVALVMLLRYGGTYRYGRSDDERESRRLSLLRGGDGGS